MPDNKQYLAELFKKFTKNNYSLSGFSESEKISMVSCCDPQIAAFISKYIINNASIGKMLSMPYENLADKCKLSDNENFMVMITNALFREMIIEKLVPIHVNDEPGIHNLLRRLYKYSDIEQFYLMPIVGNNIIDAFLIAEGSTDNVDISINLITDKLKSIKNCKKYIISHNHPNETSKPSDADIYSTECLILTSFEAGYRLIAHYIYGTNGFNSLDIKSIESSALNNM